MSSIPPPPAAGRDGAAGAAPGGGAAAGGRGRGGLTPEEQQRQREARLKVFDDVLEVYRKAGANPQPIEIPANITNLANTIGFILTTEGAAAFDDLTRSKDINDPSLGAWPNAFRTHRFVPRWNTSAHNMPARSSFARWMPSCLSPTHSSRQPIAHRLGSPT